MKRKEEARWEGGREGEERGSGEEVEGGRRGGGTDGGVKERRGDGGEE